MYNEADEFTELQLYEHRVEADSNESVKSMKLLKTIRNIVKSCEASEIYFKFRAFMLSLDIGVSHRVRFSSSQNDSSAVEFNIRTLLREVSEAKCQVVNHRDGDERYSLL